MQETKVISEMAKLLSQLNNEIGDYFNAQKYIDPKITNQSKSEDIEIIEKTIEQIKKLLHKK